MDIVGPCWAYVKTKTHVSNSALANWMDSRKQTILVDTALVLTRKSQHVFRMLLCQSAWPHRFPTRLPWLGCVKESKRGKKCRVTWVTWVIWLWFFIAFQFKLTTAGSRVPVWSAAASHKNGDLQKPSRTLYWSLLIIYFRANGLGILLDLLIGWTYWNGRQLWHGHIRNPELYQSPSLELERVLLCSTSISKPHCCRWFKENKRD